MVLRSAEGSTWKQRQGPEQALNDHRELSGKTREQVQVMHMLKGRHQVNLLKETGCIECGGQVKGRGH